MDLTAILLVLAALIGGLVLTVIPVAPAGITVPAALLLVISLRGWHAVPWWCWAVMFALLVLLLAVDNLLHAVGVARLGASRDAQVWGGTAIVLTPIALGIVFGPVGGVIGAPLGAVVGTIAGELRARARTLSTAGARAALGTRAIAPTRGINRRAARSGTSAAPVAPRMHHLGVAALLAWIAGMLVRIALVTVQAIIALVVVWHT